MKKWVTGNSENFGIALQLPSISWKSLVHCSGFSCPGFCGLFQEHQEVNTMYSFAELSMKQVRKILAHPLALARLTDSANS